MSVTMSQRTVKVELFQGDDLDLLAELAAAARLLKPSGQSTGVENGEYAAAAQEHDDLLAEAKTRAVVVEIRPLPRKAYQALLVEHPARDDDAGDAMLGANASTFAEPLLLASIIGPVTSDEDKQEFLDSLNHAQFTVLADEAIAMNRVVYAPKAPLLGSALSPS